MDTAVLPIPINCHPDFASYLHALRNYDVVFVPRSSAAARAFSPESPSQARLHVCREGIAGIGFTTLDPNDLPVLRSSCDSVFVQRVGSSTDRRFKDSDPVADLAAAGFRVFSPLGGDPRPASRLRQYRPISLAEFAVSDSGRLQSYPSVSAGASVMSPTGECDPGVRMVFVLDLVQDLEVLQPLLLRSAISSQWRNAVVAVTDLTMKSYNWPRLEELLRALRLDWFRALGPRDVLNVMGSGKSILITASESTAGPHRFSHELCRLAPPRALKITLQHGYECVGLRHHKAHRRAYSKGIRFASDFVFTWSHPDNLPDLHPADRGKCVPVGVVKTLANEVSTIDGVEHAPEINAAGIEDHSVSADETKIPVLIAENLHSVRFSDRARFKQFMDFIVAANEQPALSVTLRSHPAKLTLQNSTDKRGFAFHSGELRARDLVKYGFFVSPPSTILLDMVLLGVPAAVWSNQRDLGDCEYYTDLPTVSGVADLTALCRDADRRDEIRFRNYRWAAENVCAFNGAQQAWSRMNELICS